MFILNNPWKSKTECINEWIDVAFIWLLLTQWWMERNLNKGIFNKTGSWKIYIYIDTSVSAVNIFNDHQQGLCIQEEGKGAWIWENMERVVEKVKHKETSYYFKKERFFNINKWSFINGGNTFSSHLPSPK